MTTNYSIVQYPTMFVDGLQLVNANLSDNVAGTSFIILPGAARDSTNSNNIVLDAPLLVKTTIVGAGGIDLAPAPPAAERSFILYIIGDSTKYKPTSAVLSLSATQPQLPDGYNMWRRIGSMSLLTDGNIHPFFQMGHSDVRKICFNDQHNAFFGFSSLTATAFGLSKYIPPFKTVIDLIIACASPGVATISNTVSLGGGDGSNGFPLQIFSSSADFNFQTAATIVVAPVAGVPTIAVKVGTVGTTSSCWLTGYTDYL